VRPRRLRLVAAGCAAVLCAVSALVGETSSVGATGSSAAIETHAVCGPVSGPHARCHAIQVLNPAALVRNDRKRPPRTTTTSTSTTTTTTTTTSSTSSTTTTTVPSSGPVCTNMHPGYTPCDLHSAYDVTSTTAGTGQTVAIVDAYDDPNAAADLAVYRSAYGLAPCTIANGCFRKVDQNGGSAYPAANTGWSEEISLDLDMVSAMCANCNILLVEAKSSSLGDLLTAENEAAALGANVISNSWGANEFSFETLYDGFFDHGIAITASSGDSGYGVSWPASSPYVTAVGGTSLVSSSTTRGWSETAWNRAGSGCSAYETKPVWQHDSGCSERTVADVSAVADPATAVAVYDSYNESGWLAFGGTSVSSPIVAAVYVLAGNAGSATPGYPYSHANALNDVTSGSNGTCGSYLCNAEPGYDGPTGLGTPNGTTGF
jgi:subtilase family serine protease